MTYFQSERTVYTVPYARVPTSHFKPYQGHEVMSRRFWLQSHELADPAWDLSATRTSTTAAELWKGAGGPPDAGREPSKEKGTSVVLSSLRVMLVQHGTENGSRIQ